MPIVYYKEKQRFNRLWISITLGLITGLWFMAIVWQVILGHPLGSYPVSNLGVFLLGFIFIIPVILFLFLQLRTEIRSDGVYYKLWPASMKWKKIPREQIVTYSLKTRAGKSKSSKIKSIYIQSNTGNGVTIGTQRDKDFLLAMHKMMKSQGRQIVK